MPQSSFRARKSYEAKRNEKIKEHTKSISSKEIRAYERYYDIEKSVGQAFRNDHYVVDEFIYKTRTASNPSKADINRSSHIPRGSEFSSRSKPITCPINDDLPRSAQSRKSYGHLKNAEVELKNNDLQEPAVDYTKVPMDWDSYHRLEVIHKFMDDLEAEFPSLCTTGVIGKSLENRDLKVLKISNSDASNCRVWIDAGIHAREWIAPAVNTFVANHIARNFDNLPESVRNKDWYFMPVLNPDGYEYTHTTNRMWRKNKATIRHKLFGVDLNRNFSFGWGGKGSSDEPSNSFYRGPRPFSEPETAAMKEIFLNSGVNFQVYITLHSFGQVIIMPFAYRDDLAPDYIRLLEGATVMSKAIYDTNGNTYKVGISKDVMYHASGTSNDWSHGEVGIPFCYLIELRSKKHKFKVPKEEIAETGKEILNCVIALMEFVDNCTTPIIEERRSPSPKSDISDIISEKSEESVKEIQANKIKKKVVSKVNSRDRYVEGDVKRKETKPKTIPLYEQLEEQDNKNSVQCIPLSRQTKKQVKNPSLTSLKAVQVNNLYDESVTSTHPIDESATSSTSDVTSGYTTYS